MCYILILYHITQTSCCLFVDLYYHQAMMDEQVWHSKPEVTKLLKRYHDTFALHPLTHIAEPRYTVHRLLGNSLKVKTHSTSRNIHFTRSAGVLSCER